VVTADQHQFRICWQSRLKAGYRIATESLSACTSFARSYIVHPGRFAPRRDDVHFIASPTDNQGPKDNCEDPPPRLLFPATRIVLERAATGIVFEWAATGIVFERAATKVDRLFRNVLTDRNSIIVKRHPVLNYHVFLF
jgi:hypothetical protein